MAARHNVHFANALRGADLVTADGIGIVLAARLIEGVVVARVTGVELVEGLAKISAEQGAGIYFLGASPGVGRQAGMQLAKRFPGLVVAGDWAGGSPDAADDVETVDRIMASGARIVLVAYGAPGQVLWIARNQGALTQAGVRIAIGVGGAFDYLSDTIQRPPALVRKIGLEWLARLVREPWRWRRQAVLPIFAAMVMRRAIHVRLQTLRRRPRP